MTFKIPNLSLVVLIGPSGSGKSTFARKHFLPTEILSSDACRGMVSDDENDQAATKDAFEVLRFIAGKRLALGKLTVIDATNVQAEARKPLLELGASSITASRWRSCSTFRNASATNGTSRGPIGTSAPTSSATRRRSSARARSAAFARKGSVTSSSWRPRPWSRRPPSRGCRSGTTDATNRDRSTSSVMFTAAAMSWN